MKMISAWGSNGSGKTTFALALASALAKQKKNVVIVSLDMKSPSLAQMLPKAKLSANNSIGTLLSSDGVTYDALRSKIHIHPQSERIGVAGFISGENPVSSKVFKRERIIDFLRVLDESPFNYIIFDCDSNTYYDQLSLYALEISDFVFRLLTPDVKGLEFEKSALMWMRNSENFNVDRHIKIASQCHDTSPATLFTDVSGNVQYRLPWANEIYNKFSAGELISQCKEKKAHRYEQIIDKIAKDLVAHE